MTPFDPKPMAGEATHAARMAAVTLAIEQAGVLLDNASASAKSIHTFRTKLMPLLAGSPNVSLNETLNRREKDLNTLVSVLTSYKAGLEGWKKGESQQHQANMFLAPPAEVLLYVESIKEGKDFALPTHTG